MRIVEAKVVILGSQAVGKTSLITRFENNVFYSNTSSTIGASFTNLTLDTEKFKIRMQIWDTAGQERFRALAPMYYRGANVAVLVFDITIYSSFTDVFTWVNELEKHEKEDSKLLYIVLGNKCDLDGIRKVSKAEAIKYAKSIDAAYFETSALTSEGIYESFMFIANELGRRAENYEENKLKVYFSQNEIKKEDDYSLQLDASLSKRGGCCR